jgi:YbbR domain-containing protein
VEKMNNVSFSSTTRKILSVAIAVILWFYVITEQNPVVLKDITIPVKIVNMEALNRSDLIMLEDPASYSVTIRIKGKKETLDLVNERTLTAYGDISGNTYSGAISIPVIINGIPDGASITNRSDHSIRVTLDKKISVQKTVAINITGNPILGLASLPAVATPTDVVLTGAESLINRVKMVKVDVDIAGANANVEKKLPVKLLDEAGKDVAGIQLDSPHVNVVIPISNTKRVPIQLQLEGTPAEGYMIADQYVTPREILLTGEQSVLDSLNAITAKPMSINANGASPTSGYEVPVELELPAGVRLANPSEQIKAHVDIQQVVTDTLETSNIELRNLDQKYTVLDSPPRTVKLIVRGPKSLMKDLAQNITLYVDLINAKEGVNSCEILLEKAAKLEVLEVTPPHLPLEIKIRE